MLTGKLVRVRHRKNQVIPLYVSPHDTAVRLVAEQLITLYRQSVGRRRGQLEEELADLIPEGPQGLLPAGLAHLLEERCTFETTAPLPPEEVRAVVFALAAQKRQQWAAAGLPFDRRTILAEAASHFGPLGTAEKLDQALFADLKCEQRITSFEDISVDRLLDRYNVALAQAVLLRAVRLDVDIEGETPARFRQLFRALKFHRLIASIQAAGPDRYHLQVDGPLSLFSATQKYGLQLALFLPSLLHCRRFSLCAQLRWSYGNRAARDKTFTLSSADGLRSHLPDFGTYTPPELEAFIQSFANKNYGWSLQAEPLPLRLGEVLWVPDARLVHRTTGREVYLEFFGFWRKTDIVTHHARLQQHLPGRFLLCLGEGLRLEAETLNTDDPAIYRYKRFPLVEEVIRRASRLAGLTDQAPDLLE